MNGITHELTRSRVLSEMKEAAQTTHSLKAQQMRKTAMYTSFLNR